MNADLVQLIALASSSNAVLARRITLESFYPSHSAFQGCRKITFEDPAADRKTLDSPVMWLKYLAKNGFARLHLNQSGDDQTGAESLILVAEQHGKFLAWLRTGADHRPWDIDYHLLSAGSNTGSAVDLASAKQSLQQALSEIQCFANRHHLGFGSCFTAGLKSLDASSPLKNCRHHPLVAARLYLLEARQLMASCWHLWVFGGMGSWNDVGFNDVKTMRHYEKVPDALYSALMSGIQVSVNSFPQ